MTIHPRRLKRLEQLVLAQIQRGNTPHAYPSDQQSYGGEGLEWGHGGGGKKGSGKDRSQASTEAIGDKNSRSSFWQRAALARHFLERCILDLSVRHSLKKCAHRARERAMRRACAGVRTRRADGGQHVLVPLQLGNRAHLEWIPLDELRDGTEVRVGVYNPIMEPLVFACQLNTYAERWLSSRVGSQRGGTGSTKVLQSHFS
eukprot:4184346-Pleurochrysis_carterae.AAC.1